MRKQRDLRAYPFAFSSVGFMQRRNRHAMRSTSSTSERLACRSPSSKSTSSAAQQSRTGSLESGRHSRTSSWRRLWTCGSRCTSIGSGYTQTLKHIHTQRRRASADAPTTPDVFPSEPPLSRLDQAEDADLPSARTRSAEDLLKSRDCWLRKLRFPRLLHVLV